MAIIAEKGGVLPTPSIRRVSLLEGAMGEIAPIRRRAGEASFRALKADRGSPASPLFSLPRGPRGGAVKAPAIGGPLLRVGAEKTVAWRSGV